MKQLICILACMTLLLSGCGGKDNSPAYKDGTYQASAVEYDESGWKDYVEITISGGKIIQVEWDSVREDGASKKELSKTAAYDMVAGGAKSQWYEQAASMETALLNEQSPDKIKLKSDGKPDAVSGVTIKVNEFVALAQEALKSAV